MTRKYDVRFLDYKNMKVLMQDYLPEQLDLAARRNEIKGCGSSGRSMELEIIFLNSQGLIHSFRVW